MSYCASAMTKSEQQASSTLELAKELVQRRSLTPDSTDCQSLIADSLRRLGFSIEEMNFDDVKNIWARKGTAAPLFVFAGHTDVVPTGPEEQWRFPPFEPSIEEGRLYGRGTADMKCAIAAMITATERYLETHSTFPGSIAFLITGDEEGAAVNGTARVIETLEARGEKIDFCIVGESTANATVGDTMKNGRRGSLHALLTVKGVQGHVAYPDRSLNPIHACAPALTELCAQRWDEGNEFFSPTTMQISNIHSGTGADNVIPGSLEAMINFRFSSAVTATQLQERLESVLNKHGLNYEVKWRVSGQPFLTQPGSLTDAAIAAVKEIVGVDCQLSTTGGTSDARFIAPTGAQVIELGLVNETIHRIDEHIKIDDLNTLALIYERVLAALLAN
jgi:succinyl-diaminopimelate desuccinylase